MISFAKVVTPKQHATVSAEWRNLVIIQWDSWQSWIYLVWRFVDKIISIETSFAGFTSSIMLYHAQVCHKMLDHVAIFRVYFQHFLMSIHVWKVVSPCKFTSRLEDELAEKNPAGFLFASSCCVFVQVQGPHYLSVFQILCSVFAEDLYCCQWLMKKQVGLSITQKPTVQQLKRVDGGHTYIYVL